MNVDRIVVIIVDVVSGTLIQLLLLQSHLCHHLERQLHIDGVLGRGLENRVVHSAQLVVGDVHQLLLQRRDPAALVHVDFVAYYDEREVLWVQHVQLDQKLILPRGQVVKRFLIGDIVAEYTAVCTSVESYAQTLETLLSGCVPDLQGNGLAVDGQVLIEKVSTNRCFILLTKLGIHKLVHQRRFAHPQVSEDNNFKECLFAGQHVWMSVVVVDIVIYECALGYEQALG